MPPQLDPRLERLLYAAIVALYAAVIAFALVAPYWRP